MDRQTLNLLLDRLGLRRLFTTTVCAEDGMDTLSQVRRASSCFWCVHSDLVPSPTGSQEAGRQGGRQAGTFRSFLLSVNG